MPAIAAIQHSIVTLENGNAIVHVSEKSENIGQRVTEVLGKFTETFRVRWMDLSETEGLTTLSLVLEPCEAPGESVFIYRADRALFFGRIGAILAKFGISNRDVSKCVMAESLGHISAVYSYELKNG